MWERALLAILAALAASAACGANVNGTLGVRDETEDEDRLPAAGIAADFGPERWIWRPEAGVAVALDPVFGGNETEFSFGVLGYWQPSVARIHFGLGVSSLSSDFGANSGSTTGAYMHGGLSWPTRTRWIGLDVRYLGAGDLRIDGTRFPVGYFQFAVLFGF